MFSVTDTTLCVIDIKKATKKTVKEYCKALTDFGIDFIEMQPEVFSLLAGSASSFNILIRDDGKHELSKFKKVAGFVSAQNIKTLEGRKIIEKNISEISDDSYAVPDQYELRLVGDKALFEGTYPITFRKMLKNLPKTTSFCTKDAGYAATALMIEWVLAGGKNIVTSYMGMGGFAPMEETVMSLRSNGYDVHKINPKYLSVIGNCWESLTGNKIPEHKAVAGRNIFHVESGVHVNGIMKNSKNYEPFSPEEIGSKRKIILGKYSGRSSVLMKLKELNLNAQFFDIDRLVQSIKFLSSERGYVSDKDFLAYISEFTGDDRSGQKKNLSY